MMSTRLFSVAAIAWALSAVACGVPSNAATQSSGSAVTGSASSGQAGTGAASWDAVATDAKQEGRLVIFAPPGDDVQTGLTAGFQRRYPAIPVEVASAGGSELLPKLLTERQAGQYRVDLYINGTTTIIADLMPARAVAPIRPFLVGPDIDPAQWTGGKLDFADDQEVYDLVFMSNVKSPLAFNPTLVPAGSFKSWRDLTDAKWKGQLAMEDPRGAGPSEDQMLFIYSAPELGKEFLAQFLTSGIVLTKDRRQVLDWIGQGKYPVGVAPSESLTAQLTSKGVPIQLLAADELKEGNYITSGFGTVAVMDRAPHPNAAKLYLNWLLSKDGQTEVSKAAGYTSRRLDVPRDHLPPVIVPKPGVTYKENYKERGVKARTELQQYIKTVLPS